MEVVFASPGFMVKGVRVFVQKDFSEINVSGNVIAASGMTPVVHAVTSVQLAGQGRNANQVSSGIVCVHTRSYNTCEEWHFNHGRLPQP